MLSLEEQIGRIADSAVQALDPAVTVVPAGRRGRSGRPVIVWAALAVAAAVALVVVISNRAPNKATGSVGTVSVTTAPGGSSTVPVTLGLSDSQPVKVTGTRLPLFDDKLTSDPAVGSTAPIINGADFRRNPVTIDGSATGPILVVFVAPWSPHSNSEIKALIDWKRNALVPASLKVVGVVSAVSKNIGDPPASWLSGNGWDWPVMVDQSKGDGVAGVAAEAYGANGFPYMVLVGSDGKVKLRLSGEVSPTDLQQSIEKALTTTAATAPSTVAGLGDDPRCAALYARIDPADVSGLTLIVAKAVGNPVQGCELQYASSRGGDTSLVIGQLDASTTCCETPPGPNAHNVDSTVGTITLDPGQTPDGTTVITATLTQADLSRAYVKVYYQTRTTDQIIAIFTHLARR